MSEKTNALEPESFTHLKLDDITLEKKSSILPDDLKEDYIWLGAFTRTDCNGDADLLNEKFKEVGVYRDKSTWVRILKGQWNRNSAGGVRSAPIVAKEKLKEDIEALRTGVRRESMEGKVPFIMTSTAKSIFEYIDLIRQPGRVNKFGMIIGPTGGQKTATYKEYERRNNHGAVRRYEAPENASISELIGAISRGYGGHIHDARDRRRQRVFESFGPNKTLIIDNAQDLYKESRGSDQLAFGFLRRLQDERGGTIILSITPTFEKQLMAGMVQGYFEQFEGRCGGRRSFLKLPEYAPREDVVMIAKSFGLAGAGQHATYLQDIAKAQGRIRTYFGLLQDAKFRAEAMQTPLSISIIKELWET